MIFDHRSRCATERSGANGVQALAGVLDIGLATARVLCSDGGWLPDPEHLAALLELSDEEDINAYVESCVDAYNKHRLTSNFVAVEPSFVPLLFNENMLTVLDAIFRRHFPKEAGKKWLFGVSSGMERQEIETFLKAYVNYSWDVFFLLRDRDWADKCPVVDPFDVKEALAITERISRKYLLMQSFTVAERAPLPLVTRSYMEAVYAQILSVADALREVRRLLPCHYRQVS